MRIVMFYHSLLSDWNHGNAHFLRGIVTELLALGHDVQVYEPVDAWSIANLVSEHGDAPLLGFHQAYPHLHTHRYALPTFNLDSALAGAHLVLVHEWNDHGLVAAVGRRRAAHGYRLLFHDTHHRSVTDPAAMRAYDLSEYDGVLAFGDAVRTVYLQHGWTAQAWTWHEAADVRVFHPRQQPQDADLVWVGNWGDGERSAELHTYLIEPVRRLGLRAHVYGVRYPADAVAALRAAGIGYRGWLPNFDAPRVFAQHRVTVHVPRRPYVEALPGIPTIRVFEALACGIPLVSAPWHDAEHLFTPGSDYLLADGGEAMTAQLHRVLNDPALAHALAQHGRATILARHTCAHRAAELMTIYRTLTGEKEQLPHA